MSHIEQYDAATVLDDWTNRVANLPNEIAFMYEEIEQKDKQLTECLSIINKHDNALQNWVRKNGGHIQNPKESILNKIIIENYDKAQALQSEKIALAQKCQQVVDKHTRNLDVYIKALQDRGEFQIDPDFPSLLQTRPTASGTRLSTTATPQIPTPTSINTRISIQNQQTTVTQQAQAQQNNSVSVSISTTPGSIILAGRQTRDLSSSVTNKKQSLPNCLSSYPSTGSTHQASFGPGTSKTATPINTAGACSVGPRTQLRVGPKKITSYGNKPIAFSRKHKKSSLTRLKRIGNKTLQSPSHDSELSGAESGSINDEDEKCTPKCNKDADRDENMADIEEEDGADDRKYCTCRSVSYGDMVACDNPTCEFEWFHWSCVGLKSEPLGTWICAACKASGFKK